MSKKLVKTIQNNQGLCMTPCCKLVRVAQQIQKLGY